MVVNNPLIRPYFLRGWHRGGTLRFPWYDSGMSWRRFCNEVKSQWCICIYYLYLWYVFPSCERSHAPLPWKVRNIIFPTTLKWWLCESLGRYIYIQNGLKPSSSTVGSEIRRENQELVSYILGIPISYPPLKLTNRKLKMDAWMGLVDPMFGFPNWAHHSLTEGGACMSCGNHPWIHHGRSAFESKKGEDDCREVFAIRFLLTLTWGCGCFCFCGCCCCCCCSCCCYQGVKLQWRFFFHSDCLFWVSTIPEEHVVANPHDDDMLHHKPEPISILDESIGPLGF